MAMLIFSTTDEAAEINMAPLQISSFGNSIPCSQPMTKAEAKLWKAVKRRVERKNKRLDQLAASAFKRR